MPDQQMTKYQIVERGKQIYDDKLRSQMERDHMGEFIVVDVLTGDYELGEDDAGASLRMLERRPSAQLYGLRIGQTVAYRFESCGFHEAMMQGVVDSQLRAIVGLTFTGDRSRAAYMQSSIPGSTAACRCICLFMNSSSQPLDARRRTADGTKTVLETFVASVTWEGVRRPITVVESDGGCMLGMEMLKNYRLTIDVSSRWFRAIEPIA
jgi:hypothetical protein